ncbi:N-acetylmuramoyl-L-alanine amidase family protein [Butyrivibrio sp. WCD2001]|uniref:N-acetylmuramoyl-L-alanine amidase family protein n=1 Tax=Butyrivibrio sp. WCD2001 TaxID=1280681 RepID=UPI00041D4E81|nr:N-acetylmuramoyl-L-alanine amidase [Butyrivibrio sp. WCD2001]
MSKKAKRAIPFIALGVSFVVLLTVVVAVLLRDPVEVRENSGDEAEQVVAQTETVDAAENAAEDPESSTDNQTVTEESAEVQGEGVNIENSEADKAQEQTSAEEVQSETEDQATAEDPQNVNEEQTNEADAQNSDDAKDAAQVESSSEDAQVAGEEQANAEEVQTETVAAPAETPHTGGHIICIDPGHQNGAMTDKEPNGPGSSTMKMKVTGGTAGKTTGLAEYQLALTIGLMLKDELTRRGYTVIMTRESNDVRITNIERAQIANNAGAEAFVRIHANGSDDTSVNGAMTICQTPSNPYNANMYSQSRKLSDCVLDAYIAATGFKKQYVWETDTMTGINWATVPSTIIEMGYMSNPTDDTNMASPEYQQKMMLGIANGIDNYFAQ